MHGKRPSIAMFVHAGELTPTVVSTAFSRDEADELRSWIAEHRDLEELVRRALSLAEPELPLNGQDSLLGTCR